MAKMEEWYTLEKSFHVTCHIYKEKSIINECKRKQNAALILKINKMTDFPGIPMAKCFPCREHTLDPWLGN